MKILIIESDSSFASTLVHSLEARGLDVTTAADGQKGLELAKAEPPGAIVLSVELGDRRTGGFSLCNKLKRDEALKDLPLVLMSSSASEETLTQHSKLKTRADHYLQKPFSPEELLRVLGLPEESEDEPEQGKATIDLGGIEDLDLTGLVGRDFFGGALLGGDEEEKEGGEEWEELIVEPEEDPIALPDDKGSAKGESAEADAAAWEAERAAWREKEAAWSAERARLEAELTEARAGLERLEAEKSALEGQLTETRNALENQLAETRSALESQLAEARNELEAARQSAAGSQAAEAKVQKLEQDLARNQERLLRAVRKLKLDKQVHQQLRGQLMAATELLDSIDTKAAGD